MRHRLFRPRGRRGATALLCLSVVLVALSVPAEATANPNRFRQDRQRVRTAWNKLRRPGRQSPVGRVVLRTSSLTAVRPAQPHAATRGIVRRAGSAPQAINRVSAPGGPPPGVVQPALQPAGPQPGVPQAPTQWSRALSTQAARSPQYRAVPILGRARASAPSGPASLADLPVVQLKGVRFVGQGAGTRVEAVPNQRPPAAGYTTAPAYTKAPPTRITGGTPPSLEKAPTPPGGFTPSAGGGYVSAKLPPRYETVPPITTVDKNNPRSFDSVQVQY